MRVDIGRFDQVRAEWVAMTRLPPGSLDHFDRAKREADMLVSAGAWTSGPSDMMSVLGRHRDEILHSRMLAWLLGPTNRHGLGRRFLAAFADRLWPAEELFRQGLVTVSTEETGSAADEAGELREARADIVIRGEGVTIVIENKLDAGEQPAQCERQYWGWSAHTADARFVFLTPSGRPPTTTESDAARNAWRTASYADVRDTLGAVLAAAPASNAAGRLTALQYLSTLQRAVAPQR